MGAPTGANGSCCSASREFLMVDTRLLYIKAPSEPLFFDGSNWELLRELLWSS